jgi:hypothetical protein
MIICQRLETYGDCHGLEARGCKRDDELQNHITPTEQECQNGNIKKTDQIKEMLTKVRCHAQELS